MKRSVRLSLTKETLTALGAGDLGAVAGGASSPTCYSCVECLVHLPPSLDRPTACESELTFRTAC